MNSCALTLAFTLVITTGMLPGTLPAQNMEPGFTIDEAISPAFPYNLVAAKKGRHVAWIENARGARNVYTAAAPDFLPRRLTSTTADDGVDLRPLQISDDGSIVVWISGHAPGIGSRPDMPGWIANPAADPAGGRNEVWAAATDGQRPPWRVVAAHNFALSPDGRYVLFEQEGQIHCASVDAAIGGDRDAGAAPLIRDFGVNVGPAWSPDGRRIAYVSVRDDHAFVAVYDTATRRITYMAPSVDYDSMPAWSPDGRRIAFLRRPGRPFADWPEAEDTDKAAALPEGFVDGQLAGSHTQSIWIADADSGRGRVLWHAPRGFGLFPDSIRWVGEHLVFSAEPDGWRHLYTLAVDAADAEALLLTPGDGEVEHVAASTDGRSVFYTANIGDPDRRQLWRVQVPDGRAEQLTSAPGITTYPAVPGEGGAIAVLQAGPRQPLSVALLPQNGGSARIVAPVRPAPFPQELHVEPHPVVLTASDGLRSHAQVMLPPDVEPGERRPALLFIHGGPRQQTLLGYPYQAPHGFYHLAYGLSQYFANKGYITLSVNYRGGIGYGREFREASERGAFGNSEYRDVLAAGQWLREHAQVDPERIGVWGLSYGGMLATQALARDSDLFAAGVAIGGFALWEWSLDPDSVSFRASPVAAIETWKSPVLLIHGDDDRNVDFSYTVALVQLLRAQKIPHELIVFPNETHYFLVWQRWVQTFHAMDDFFDRKLIGMKRQDE